MRIDNHLIEAGGSESRPQLVGREEFVRRAIDAMDDGGEDRFGRVVSDEQAAGRSTRAASVNASRHRMTW